MRLLIKGGHIVNEGRTLDGYIVIEDGQISEISQLSPLTSQLYDEVIDATGCYVLPGIIDDHVSKLDLSIFATSSNDTLNTLFKGDKCQ